MLGHGAAALRGGAAAQDIRNCRARLGDTTAASGPIELATSFDPCANATAQAVGARGVSYELRASAASGRAGARWMSAVVLPGIDDDVRRLEVDDPQCCGRPPVMNKEPLSRFWDGHGHQIIKRAG